MDEQKHSDDTRVDGGVKVKKRKKRKKHLFKLSAMNELVDENSFLKNKYDKLSAGAEEKLGYHWNEVVQNILFNKYVKPNETLMGRYLEIKRRDELEHDKKKSHPAATTDKEKKPESHHQDPPETPVEAPLPAPNDPLDTRITTESTDTISAGNYQHVGPLVTTKGGMDAWMRNWESKIKKDKSGMTIIRENNMLQNSFKTMNESGNPLANPALMDAIFETLEPKKEKPLNEGIQDDIARGHQNANNTSPALKLANEIKSILESMGMKEIAGRRVEGAIILGQGEATSHGAGPVIVAEISVREQVELTINNHIAEDADITYHQVGEPLNANSVKASYQKMATKGGLNEGEAKPAALVQIGRLHKETEKASNGYYKKEQKDRNLNMVETKDGGAEQKHEFDKDSVKPEDVKKHHPSKEEEEYVKLNRGGNLADRAIQGIKDMPKDFKERMKDEAGADAVKDAEAKAKEIEKVQPALAPPARTQAVNEGVVISARYITPMSRKIVSFNTAKAEKLETLNENFILLETKGFGNDATPGAKSIIENHDFFIDLGKDQIYMLDKKANTLNESVVTIQKNEYDRMRKLITYSPSKWLGTK